ncbi:hypothetical protein A8U91_03288 [Halomonas elongata]|uniref:Urease accessory protein UreH-like transmembrane domain-containing protein n=1 Tax=Halomonas elongata TaxID=2746 RepID=A0A1B8NW72_HALEL|nr:hypothetical protein A8U91_03288 [Halomonas elongata]
MRQPARLAGLLLGYNLGRVTSYMCAGVLAATLGTLVGIAPGARLALQVIAATMLILMALYIADWWKGYCASKPWDDTCGDIWNLWAGT